jgi:hypothetical protein
MRKLDKMVWSIASDLLRHPEPIREDVERLRREDPTEQEIATLDATIRDVESQRRRLGSRLALVDEGAASELA